MKKKSKGRLERFESQRREAPEEVRGEETYDIASFMAEGWRNVEREDALRDDPYDYERPDNIVPLAPAEEEEKAPYDAVQIQRPKAEDRQKKTNPAKRRRRLVYWAIVILILVTVGFTVQHLLELRAEQQALIAEQQELEQRKEDLTKELKRVNDPDYIEQKAREQLHLIKPGEILYIMPEEDQ